MLNRYTFAGLLAVLAAVGLAGLAFAALGSDAGPAPVPDDKVADRGDRPQGATPPPTRTPTAKPGQKPKTLAEAARLAGCRLIDAPDEGNEHVTREVTAADYGTNPPTSGIHAPEWAEDGVYAADRTPDLGTLVHTLEHGRIDIQYRPGTSAATVAKLVKLYKSLDHGYHMLLFQNQTGMPFAVAASAWTHLLGCPAMNDRVLDALRFFRLAYVDAGPEVVP